MASKLFQWKLEDVNSAQMDSMVLIIAVILHSSIVIRVVAVSTFPTEEFTIIWNIALQR